MKIQTAIIGFALVGQLSCSTEHLDINSFKDDSSITTLNGTWKVVSFENYIDNSVELKNQENSGGYDIIIELNDTKNPNELSGQNTTNTILATFFYVQNRQFRVQNLQTTEVAQPRWADEFTKAILDGEVAFRINKERLRFLYSNQQKSVTLVKQ